MKKVYIAIGSIVAALICAALIYFAATRLNWSWCSRAIDACVEVFHPKRVTGMDVSHHQGKIDWKKVKQSFPDCAFVYIKCTEGKSYVDPMHKKNASGAKKAGFPIGGYHYFRMTATPQEQFKNFKKALDHIDPDLIPVVDVETFDGKSAQSVRKNLKIFLDLLEKEYGVKPMIYSTQGHYNEICGPAFNDYELYIGKYNGGKHPPVINGKGTYTIWQYTESAKIDGISKKVDLCWFHHTKGIDDIRIRPVTAE